MQKKLNSICCSYINAVNNTDYTDVNALQMTTIDDAIYMHMKNDSSFIIASEMDLYEHQSTYNLNMPLRGFWYFGHFYEKYVKNTGKNVYGRELIEIPTPRYIVFYNGTDEMPDETVLRLSDAFMKPDDTGGYEWTAKMLNINKGHNRKLMEKCRPLKEFSIRLLEISPKACYTLARIGSKSRLTSKVHSA